jgi:signal transduction histidine kinase
MNRRDTISPGLLFVVATLMGVSSTVQGTRLTVLAGEPCCDSSTLAKLLILNLVYWYVPALLAPAIMMAARRLHASQLPRGVTVLLHIVGAFVYSVMHTTAMLGVRAALLPFGGRGNETFAWWTYAQRQYFMQLDWLLVTYFFLVGLALAMAYRLESERHALRVEQLHSRLIEAKLQSLQRQLHPHFLFNTLNTISGLMHQDVRAADMMIDRLSDLLRTTLDTSGLQEVPLAQELDVLRTYLDIEQTRFGSRLSVDMRIADGAERAFVPNFLLQPLVENAIRHGIAPHARPGRLEIVAALDNERLHLEVRDTGYGVPPDRLTALNTGVGLSNTRARLDHLYGASHTFVFANVKGGGFSVIVTIPFSTSPSGRVPLAEEVA